MGGEVGRSSLEQERGELGQDRCRFLALLVERVDAADQLDQGVGVADFGETFERLEAILALESFSFQQRHVNKFAARGFAQFLVRQTAKDVCSRSRALGQKECLLGWFVSSTPHDL